MTINLKNFLSDKSKLSKMGEFQDLKPLDGLEVSSISADLYNNGRDDLALFYFKEGANYATLTTTNSIVSETISWNENSIAFYYVADLAQKNGLKILNVIALMNVPGLSIYWGIQNIKKI